jgi:hypothetical protein
MSPAALFKSSRLLYHRHHASVFSLKQQRNFCPSTCCASSSYAHGSFDLPLAVSLAYTSFEAYLQPIGAEGYEDIAFNGTKTTFADGEFLSHVYKGVLLVEVMSASNLRPVDVTGKSDPYAVVSVNASSRTTPVVWHNLNPAWGTRMCLYITDPNEDLLKIRVYDKGLLMKGDEDLGYAILPVSSFIGSSKKAQEIQGGFVGSLFDLLVDPKAKSSSEGVEVIILQGSGSGGKGETGNAF